jgi:hypothetical protein
MPTEEDAMDEAEIQKGLEELNRLSGDEYGQPLAVMMRRDIPYTVSSADRVGRLAGVVIKEPFATAQAIQRYGGHLGACRTWVLKDEEGFAAAAAARPWQLVLLERIIDEQGTGETVYALARDAQNEAGFFGRLAQVVRKYVCGDPTIRAAVDKRIKEAKLEKVAGVMTPEWIMGAGGLSLGGYLVQHVPVLGYAGAPVVAGTIVVLYVLGVEAFCEKYRNPGEGASERGPKLRNPTD